ncbi:hypothetical protein B0H14DRAFT_3507366 [Mycena olivaceomarginata]|nr:hypothetical protein B0H14DRAFT_3507366 [Mycena olivaceomarginata]
MASDSTKQERHAAAQRQYRASNIEAVRAKNRERMRLKRANRTAEEVAAAAEKRRARDADYNEHRRRCKYVDKYGHQQFMENYFPLYEKTGQKHLPGLKWGSEVAGRQRKQHIRTASTSSRRVHKRLARGPGIAAGDISDGCHKTTGARAYESDADSDTDNDTEGPKAHARVLAAIVSPKKSVKPERGASTQHAESVRRERSALTQRVQTIKRAPSVPVKRAPSASVPVMRRTVKAELVSPPKKTPLYADCEDSDLEEDLFKSDSSIEVPLAASRAASRPKSVLSTLDEDEDMPMPSRFRSTNHQLVLTPPSLPPRRSPAAPAAAPATSSSGGRGSPRVATPSRGHAVSISAHLLYNRRTGVLYEDPEKGVEEMGRGDSMEVVKRGNVAQWPGQSSGENLGTLRNHDMPDDAQDDSNNESDAHGSDAHGNGSDGDGDGDSHSPRREKIRRIVDFDVKDSEWEDLVDDTLSGLGATTHRSRNPHLPTNPLRKHRRRVVAGPNVRATAQHRRSGPPTTKRLKGLAEDLDAWEVEHEERVQQLAEKHGMKVAEVRRRMLGLSTYGGRRKPSLYNAKVSRIMAGLNAGRGVGERYTMPEVKAMVAEDPSMLEGFSREEEKEMIKDTLANRKAKARGTRANHLSAAADAKRTMDRLMVEITNLAERGTIQSWGALDFFREVMKKDPADVAHLFELWAVSRERGKTSKNKLLTMQQECTSIITTGLQAILNVTKCAMNYENYISKLVRGKGVGLVNWPDGVDFKRMSLQSAVGPLQTLLDSLKCGTTRWKVLTSAEKQKLIEQYDEMVKKGEVKVKEKTKGRKERKAKKGDDEDDEDEEESRARKPPAKPKRAPKPHARDEDEDEEELHARKPPVKSKRAPKPPARDEDDDEEEGDEEEPRARKPPVEEPRPVQAAAAQAPAKSSRTSKRSARDEDEEDESPPRKRKAKSRPATAQERLRALVQKGREANDKARRKSSTAAKEGGTKRKRAEHGEGNGDAPVGKRRRTEEGSNVQGEPREAEAEATLPHRHDCHGLFQERSRTCCECLLRCEPEQPIPRRLN